MKRYKSFEPTGDRIVVRPDSHESRAALPDGARRQRRETGVVLAVGPGRRVLNPHAGQRGEFILEPVEYKPGDRILWASYAEETRIDDHTRVLILQPADVLGKLDTDAQNAARFDQEDDS